MVFAFLLQTGCLAAVLAAGQSAAARPVGDELLEARGEDDGEELAHCGQRGADDSCGQFGTGPDDDVDVVPGGI